MKRFALVAVLSTVCVGTGLHAGYAQKSAAHSILNAPRYDLVVSDTNGFTQTLTMNAPDPFAVTAQFGDDSVRVFGNIKPVDGFMDTKIKFGKQEATMLKPGFPSTRNYSVDTMVRLMPDGKTQQIFGSAAIQGNSVTQYAVSVSLTSAKP